MKKEMLMIGGGTPRMMARFREHFTVHDAAEIPDLDAFAKKHGDAIEGVATFGAIGIKKEIADQLKNLKIISCYGVGYDAIDIQSAIDRGIIVTHTPNVLNNDVANTAIMLMLAVSRRLIRDDQWVRSGNWAKKGNAPLTRSIEDKRVGILGLGRIGETIAKKLTAFDCDISYHSRNQKEGVVLRYYPTLLEMAKNVDYLVAITPGGPSTNKIVNREVMDALGPEGTLINIARGSVVDQAELVKALQEGRLGNAGLDVFENEPQTPSELYSMDNVVLLPHVASATLETRQAMGDLTVDNIVSYFETGKPVSPIPECQHMVK